MPAAHTLNDLAAVGYGIVSQVLLEARRRAGNIERPARFFPFIQEMGQAIGQARALGGPRAAQPRQPARRLEHLPVAFERDFGEKPPSYSVILGGGRHDVSVPVDTSALED